MADIRIKDIARTVSEPKASEFVETDHATDGSGKLDLAAWLAAHRNPLAPAQGLVFDGTAGATHSPVVLGSGDFTVSWTESTTAANHQITSGEDNSLNLEVRTDRIRLSKTGVGEDADLLYTRTAAKMTAYCVVRSAGVCTLYVNGAAVTTVANTSNYSVGQSYLSSYKGASGWPVGTVLPVRIFNRALTAAEVLALYERAAPDIGDYRTAFASWATTPATLPGSSGNVHWWQAAASKWVRPGQRFRVTATWDGGGTETLRLAYHTSNQPVIADTTWTSGTAQEIVLGVTGFNVNDIYFTKASAGDLTNFTATIEPIGLLLAPEVNALGVGPQWRDASGAGAHIALPGDGVIGGVSWSLPGGANGDFGETRTASGYALGRDAVVIPEGYRIARIWCSGNGTFSLGNAAAGTEIVNAFTATATTQLATLAAYVTASRKLYLTLGTATTVTYSVHLERI